ncbi:MAG: hypothetical protein R3315_04235 [Woeseiaceae bacterium]|nr:hypothetical protein [Woeseiaceae bacterium]
MNRLVALTVALGCLSACNGEIYLRDGVTDGDTFSISPYAMGNQDPVVQSWIRYSLARSVCQLDAGTDNPARANSLRCETTSRRHLAEAWIEHTSADPSLQDEYLDDLRFVYRSGWLDEYVARHFGKSEWQRPAGLDMTGYRRWEKSELAGHRPVTRIIGSWSYRGDRSAH